MPTALQKSLQRVALNAAGALRVEHLCEDYSERTARIVLLLDRVAVHFHSARSITITLPDTSDARLHGEAVTAAIADRTRRAMRKIGVCDDRAADSAEIQQDGPSATLYWS